MQDIDKAYAARDITAKQSIRIFKLAKLITRLNSSIYQRQTQSIKKAKIGIPEDTRDYNRR